MGDPDHPDSPPESKRKQTTATVKSAWSQTIEEMDILAAERRDQGWEVTTVRSHHTDPITKETNDHDRFGLFHIVSKSNGERFIEAYDDGFTEFLVYGSVRDGRRFAVTELVDPDAKRSILIAYEYPVERARGLETTASQEGRLYTYVKKIDGTILGSFEHEEYEPLLPRVYQQTEK